MSEFINAVNLELATLSRTPDAYHSCFDLHVPYVLSVTEGGWHLTTEVSSEGFPELVTHDFASKETKISNGSLDALEPIIGYLPEILALGKLNTTRLNEWEPQAVPCLSNTAYFNLMSCFSEICANMHKKAALHWNIPLEGPGMPSLDFTKSDETTIRVKLKFNYDCYNMGWSSVTGLPFNHALADMCKRHEAWINRFTQNLYHYAITKGRLIPAYDFVPKPVEALANVLNHQDYKAGYGHLPAPTFRIASHAGKPFEIKIVDDELTGELLCIRLNDQAYMVDIETNMMMISPDFLLPSEYFEMYCLTRNVTELYINQIDAEPMIREAIVKDYEAFMEGK